MPTIIASNIADVRLSRSRSREKENQNDHQNDPDPKQHTVTPPFVMFNDTICRLLPISEHELPKEIKKENVPVVRTVSARARNRSRSRSPSSRSTSPRSRMNSRRRSPSPRRRSLSPRRRSPSPRRQPRSGPTSGWVHGEIARIIDSKGFGFIQVGAREECRFDELFFHSAVMKGRWNLKDLNRGDRVKFQFEYNKDGKPQASVVEFVGPARSRTPEDGPDMVEGFVISINDGKQFGYMMPSKNIGYDRVWFHNSSIMNQVDIRQLKPKDKLRVSWKPDPRIPDAATASKVYVLTKRAKERKRRQEGIGNPQDIGYRSPQRERSRDWDRAALSRGARDNRNASRRRSRSFRGNY